MVKEHPYRSLFGLYLLGIAGYIVVHQLYSGLPVRFSVVGGIVFWLVPWLCGVIGALVTERRHGKGGLWSGITMFVGIGSVFVLAMTLG